MRHAFAPAWRPAPVLAQAKPPVNYITTEEFGAFVAQAKSSIKTVADIAKSYDLSPEEKRSVETEVGKVSSYTIPMANIPKSEGPSWLMVGGALLIGGAIGALVL